MQLVQHVRGKQARAPKLAAKARRKKQSIFGQQQQREKEAAGAGLTGDCAAITSSKLQFPALRAFVPFQIPRNKSLRIFIIDHTAYLRYQKILSHQGIDQFKETLLKNTVRVNKNRLIDLTRTRRVRSTK